MIDPGIKWTTKLVTASTGQPVTLAEAKAHLRVTTSDDDVDILRKIRAATDYAQRRVAGWRQFMSATHDLTMDGFPVGALELPFPPLRSITHIKYYDTTGTQQTFASTSSSTGIIVTTDDDNPGSVEPAYGQSWPSARSQPNAVEVRFTAGYADRPSVPDSVKEAILLLTGHFYENRESVVVGTISSEVQMAVDSLLHANEYGHYS